MKIPMDTNEEAEFDMAPMIDMVFLLLIFFMMASQLSIRQNVPLEIPTASKAVVPKERPSRFVVNIDKEGMIYGAVAVVLGIILGLILPLKKTGRSNDGWS